VPWSVSVSCVFCAAHQLRLADGQLEPIHGHNWRVTLNAAREERDLDAGDCVVDFHDLQHRLGRVIKAWDNALLNDQAPFCNGVNPSAERVAEAIADMIAMPSGVVVESVEVTEAEGCVARWHRPART
jgi:6-pyruvoyltetrahydropterin/6-carboxytetrahydropterin synthase